MAGLLGMGGMNGFSPDMGLQSLLGDAYDPAALRNMQIKRGLLGAGAAMLSQGPSQYPIGFGQMLGQGLGAGLNAAGQAQDDYMQQARTAYDVKRMGINDEWSQREQARKEKEWAEADKRKAAFDEMIGGLPEDQRGFAAAFPDQYAKQKADAMFPNAGGGNEYGLNPIWLQNPQTNEYMLVQPSKDGSAPKQMQFPQGYQPAPQNRSIDVGTGYVTQPTRGVGAPVGGVVPKDIAGQQAQEEIGINQGKKIAAAPNDIAAADNALMIVQSLRNDPNKAWGVGGTSMFNVIPGTPGRDFQVKLDQAVAGAFMTGIQQMRGMGALSDAEGKRASSAVARMDTSTSEEEFNAALDDYEAIVLQAKQKAMGYLNGTPQAQPVPQPNGVNLKQKYGLE